VLLENITQARVELKGASVEDFVEIGR
jgi:hypothetical protein